MSVLTLRSDPMSLTEASVSGARQWADRLTAILLPIISHRIERLGLEGSGAGELYATRTRENRIFSTFEVPLVDALLARDLPFDEIHEIGSGFGQLVFLFAWNGIPALGIEEDPQRLRTAETLLDVLTAIEPEWSSRARLRTERFPATRQAGALDVFPISPEVELIGDPFPAGAGSLEVARSAVLATNPPANATPEEQQAVVQAMRRYRFALVDVDRFSTEAREPGGRERVLDLFKSAGFIASEFLDLESNGCYYLFESGDDDRPVPRAAINLGAFSEAVRLFLSEWIEQSPQRQHAAGDYYRERLARGAVFQDYDIAVAGYVEGEFHEQKRFFELGTGFGELALLLALKGFAVIGIESDDLRHDGAAALVEALPSMGVRLPRLSLLAGAFPNALGLDLLSGEIENVLVSTNVTSDSLMRAMGHVLACLPLFDHLIVDVRKFGADRDEAMASELIAQFRRIGFAERAVVYSGGGADVRHFARAQTTGAAVPPTE